MPQFSSISYSQLSYLLLSLTLEAHSKKFILRQRNKTKFPNGWVLREATLTNPKIKVVKYKATNSLLGGLGMFVAGLAAGMLGIGAGAFKVIVHEKVLKIPSKVSSASSSFIIGMTALAGVSVYLFSGLLNLTLMAPMAVGTTIGAVVGGRLLNRIRDRNLRILFLVIVTLLIIQMLYKGVISL